MLPPTPLPRAGEIYLDSRGDDRVLRVSWHHEAGLVVLSMWRQDECIGSFRLAAEDVPDLIDVLRAGLDASYDAALARLRAERLTDAG